jgi:hypothetical protein
VIWRDRWELASQDVAFMKQLQQGFGQHQSMPSRGFELGITIGSAIMRRLRIR